MLNQNKAIAIEALYDVLHKIDLFFGRSLAQIVSVGENAESEMGNALSDCVPVIWMLENSLKI